MKTSRIGGQAVIEGVMMRGATSAALAVRDEKKKIRVKTWRLKKKTIWNKIPIIRGGVNFISSMLEGTKTIMAAAEVFCESEEPSKFEKWLSEKLHVDLMGVVLTFSVVLGIALAVGLFIVLPSVVSKFLCQIFELGDTSGARIWIEAGIKLVILFLYIYLTSLIPDLKRVYMYHGAEHKTINCYENDLPLDVEHAMSCKKFHNRCGTTFLFFVIMVSIVVFALLNQVIPAEIIENELLRVLIKIAALPITAGLAYELLMVIASSNFFLFYPLRLPGMLLQKITTKEPTEDIQEVALVAFKAVMELDENPDMPVYDNMTYNYLIDAKRAVKVMFDKAKISYDADIDWILCHVLKKRRSELSDYLEISKEKYDQIMKIAQNRAKGEPLAYVLGETEFYGYKIKCNKNALIPRQETEEVVLEALKYIDQNSRVLDLCTGTGCIAIAVAKKTGACVIASDISKEALALALENAENNDANVQFVNSDLFERVEGKFDVIISNPPYIRSRDIKTLQKEVKDYEPLLALDGKADGLYFYKKISSLADNYLNDNGVIVFEVGYDQANEVKGYLEEKFDVEIVKDMAQIERIVVGRKK
ncbi:MAG: peptide chain release factor N(5)-glutamine methyltransferase [Clostridia bacterium]|nr:peptide chain release factor N(5)-glutamine methyltransferase [Clostridia bacterium]